MKLLFDLYTSQGSKKVKYHGGGTYGQNLLVELLLSKQQGLDIVILKGDGTINSNLEEVLNTEQPKCIQVNSTQDIVNELLTGKYDTFYTSMPYYLEEYKTSLKECATKILGTIHGLREIELSYDKSYRSYLRNPIAKFKQFIKYYFPKKRLEKEIQYYQNIIEIVGGNILTVSKHTKHQILNIFSNIQPNNVFVLNPIDKKLKVGSDIDINKLGLIRKKYFLLTSCDRPVKNAFRALSALDNFPINGLDDFHICCIGFRTHQKKLIKRKYSNIYKRIVFLDYVSGEELNALYENAFCFIYPSISEGFGYPPLEAMRNSVPVLSSSHTAIPEVCGDAVLYFNPHSEREIANRVSQIINETDLYEDLVSRGKKRYDEYHSNIDSQVKSIVKYILQ